MTDHTVDVSPRRKARIAGTFYLLTFLTGLPAFFVRGRFGVALGLIAGACYIVVTLLFYYIFKPVNRNLSLLAAFVSLVGCAIGPAAAGFHLTLQINPMVFFGFYCLLIGYLIFRSTFLPRILGVLLAISGLCYQIDNFAGFLWPAFQAHLEPYILLPGVAELLLALWLVVMGVNEQRWKERAG